MNVSLLTPPREWLCDITCGALDERASDVQECRSLCAAYSQVTNFELIPTVRVESQHSVGVPNYRDFPRFLFISQISRPEVGSRWRCSRKSWPFWKNPYGQIFKNVFRKDLPPLGSTSCVQISWHLADRKSVKSCVIYVTKKTEFLLALPLSLLRGARPKSVRSSSRQYTRSAPNFIWIHTLPMEL